MNDDVVEVMAKAIERLNPTWKDAQEEARAALRALEEDGYRVVPVEPTEEMVDAGAVAESDGNLAVEARNIYAAMLSALPIASASSARK